MIMKKVYIAAFQIKEGGVAKYADVVSVKSISEA